MSKTKEKKSLRTAFKAFALFFTVYQIIFLVQFISGIFKGDDE